MTVVWVSTTGLVATLMSSMMECRRISWYEEIIFTITDHGIGIPKEDIKHIFEPFQRASNTESIKGTGLGLAIVKRCIEMHSGSIEIKSTMNIGTTVIVKIPYIKPDNN